MGDLTTRNNKLPYTERQTTYEKILYFPHKYIHIQFSGTFKM